MKRKLNCILLIDDDEATNFLNCMVIEEADCTEQIKIAESVPLALNYLNESEQSKGSNQSCPCPDVIFLDINMPAMDGWEFIEKFKRMSREQQDKIKIVMVTTSLNPDDALRAKKLPVIAGFENKPLTSEMVKKYCFPAC
jgi:CheY-like chemotaxis protein